ncbi:MMPL family transporter [Bacillus mangrovi]|uniref:MMPL family transporter n=2 Tax=Metabacillus mangrovi TaxID=1491830 RepID=A0A7X2V336_9BACI|nr:MMPL family transporter [Metabacillus mangrovi]MTH51779.1 MMPL family transporter [Metabacillus mangrovi]
MKGIIKARWVLLAAWLAAAVILTITAPNMGNLVAEKGQISVPDGYSSSVAGDLLDEQSSETGSSLALVFHNEKKLTLDEKSEIQKAADLLDSKKSDLGIASVTTHFDNEELEKQMVSGDGKTILIALSLEEGGKSAADKAEDIKRELKTYSVEHYMTGSELIDQDVVDSSQEGLKKTEYITVAFILIVLVLVFRSLVAPVIPLITVGVAYMVSQSAVAYFVEYFNFPLSTFTQIFMVAVMFGIGTDYCILLLSRFKEELGNGSEKTEAVIKTFKTAGRTVIYSGLAVFAGFASIAFAEFKLYQSAVAVAVGIAFLILALVTIVPFFMMVLGSRLFWPLKGNIEHSESRSWEWAGRFSFKRPLVALLIIAAMIAPALVQYDGSLSFNSLDEIGDQYESVKAFNIISDSFGPGESLPATIVIKDDQALNNKESLAVIEKISKDLNQIEDVDKVRSATRPLGDELEDLEVASQAEELEKGLSEGNKGLQEIGDGLNDAAEQLSGSEPQLKEATAGIDQLISGSNELKNGVNSVETALKEIENGMNQGTAGAMEIKKQVDAARTSVDQLTKGSSAILTGYQQAETQLGELSKGLAAVNQGVKDSQEAISGLKTPLNSLAENPAYPGLQNDPDFQTVYGTVLGLEEGITALSEASETLSGGLNAALPGITKANAGLSEVNKGQQEFSKGLGQLSAGLGELSKGLEAASGGQNKVISSLPAISDGAGELAEGQTALKEGLSPFSDQLGILTKGLDDSAEGLSQVSGGLNEASSYLTGLAKSNTEGFYLPDEVLKNGEFQQVFNEYMSEDKTLTTMDIILKVNPYSNEALSKMDEVEDSVKRAVKGTELENATVGVSGVTSTYADLKEISDSDYTRTVLFMIAAILIILAVLLKSFVMPVYLVGSLLITYYSASAISEWIFTDLMGYDGINWAVPFFGFVILMALGIDYSIFLMDRFNEYKDLDVKSAMIAAMKNMGTVIISAAIILAGTFAAMLPSGVLSLLQIATLVLTGLILYAFVILPIFVPVMVKVFDKANWWPFMGKRDQS